MTVCSCDESFQEPDDELRTSGSRQSKKVFHPDRIREISLFCEPERDKVIVRVRASSSRAFFSCRRGWRGEGRQGSQGGITG
jgi:hypothetical protein